MYVNKEWINYFYLRFLRFKATIVLKWAGIRLFIPYLPEIWKLLQNSPFLYRVIHKCMKHLKNSQQIHDSTGHGSSYAYREGNYPSFFFFLHISQMLNVFTFGNTADICAIVHLIPHACQHITVDQSRSSGVS